MALKQSEKVLVGAAMIAGGIALVVAVGLPQFDAYNASNTEVTALKDEITNLETQKTSLGAQIKLLEKNTDIPTDIKIKTFTPDTREKMIKQALDQIVGLATGAGNIFISLSPAEVDPMAGPTPAETEAVDKTEKASEEKPQELEEPGDGEKKAPPQPPAPTLSTFGYQLAVRGTYDSVQQFLKAMSQEKELMEIVSIVLENEGTAMATSTSSSSGQSLANPKAPIKLSATIRLALQEVAP